MCVDSFDDKKMLMYELELNLSIFLLFSSFYFFINQIYLWLMNSLRYLRMIEWKKHLK